MESLVDVAGWTFLIMGIVCAALVMGILMVALIDKLVRDARWFPLFFAFICWRMKHKGQCRAILERYAYPEDKAREQADHAERGGRLTITLIIPGEPKPQEAA